jgi:2-polyprenyl-6-methoxyphenol hydroxylase-like FAD-dependent oxidoreductase
MLVSHQGPADWERDADGGDPLLPKDQRKDKRDLPNDYVYWVIIPPESSSLITDERLNHISKEGPAELAKALTAHWHPSLRLLIEDQDPNQTGVFRLLSSDPESLKRGWEPNAKVTLLGDAAHAMMPSTASGAVTALRDAELLSSLIREQGVAKEIIAKYEEEMRNYASEAVALSARIGQMSFGVKALADSEAVSA